MLYCPNYTCQTPNPESHKFCQKCRTLLPHHYLWAVGEGAGQFRAGDLLGDRYLCKGSRIFLDTKPGLYSAAPAEIPPNVVSYLRLSPYRIHIPQIYEVLPLTNASWLVLLDQAALDSSGLVFEGGAPAADVAAPQLLPALSDRWQSASAMRQLNWLWQIAHLWQPLASQQMASSVLAPELVRVEGALVRLLELRSDGSDAVSLAQLGQLWSSWVRQAHPSISRGLTQICQQLTQGQIRNAEQLISQLDTLLDQVGRSLSYQIHVAARTDQGPSRQRNEDSCYPPNGTVTTHTLQSASDTALVIVCDGIGGHQGGDVASNLAIQAVRQQVQSLSLETLDAASLTLALEKAACVANDQISQRNDSEQRFDRQRMGTTLVMGLVRGHELYITHVGDSRAYWVSRYGCYQVTQDDDVASREVRLGYSSYREALQQPSAGSLVQALGMGSSTVLHPTVQRFVLDEDTVFLLCSDGLSDNDRVEETWDTTLLPLLEGRTDVAVVSQQLIELANTRNGHDNVTVGVFHIRAMVNPFADEMPPATTRAVSAPTSGTATVIQERSTQAQPTATAPVVAPKVSADPAIAPAGDSEATAKTQVLPTRQRQSLKILPLLLGIILLSLGGGLLAYALNLSFRGWVDRLIGLNPLAVPPPTPATPSPTPVTPSTPLQIGSFLQITPSSAPASPQEPVIVLSRPGNLRPPVVSASTVSPGSIVQVVRVQATTPQERWVEVRLCSIPGNAGVTPQASVLTHLVTLPATPISPEPTPGIPTNPDAGVSPSPLNPSAVPAPQPLPPGGTGWILETQILSLVGSRPTLTPQEQGVCGQPDAPATSEPALS
ncbi:protein phosphatase 2C domain-containing protein [Oscillatoria sp. FACHB-1407]|uniref:protein phosphatase 2C domain-containing protein n=1 Tax=Oscillatoria sp. FACHB-1407 TaxID=2692847 RepID=UPI00168811C5|nr:protein phosphatase 2C domain-containing protein [Oscillatoria sp. FACHB-1407]MBD2462993.1 protein phosphatase 2C domain-containing protein [Oscillatoria sp. FACHB-1407]